jgi:hypothetical protein
MIASYRSLTARIGRGIGQTTAAPPRYKREASAAEAGDQGRLDTDLTVASRPALIVESQQKGLLPVVEQEAAWGRKKLSADTSQIGPREPIVNRGDGHSRVAFGSPCPSKIRGGAPGVLQSNTKYPSETSASNGEKP